MSFFSSNKKDKKSKVSIASSFWADEWDTYDDNIYSESYFDDTDGQFKTKIHPQRKNTLDLLRLAAHRRAIANFVNILTNRDIPVIFKTKGASFTNGKSVTISAEVTPDKFDVAVGLALHEASHINLSNFGLYDTYIVPFDIVNMLETKGYPPLHVESIALMYIRDLTNWIEDRRIDSFIFNSCPGYRDYYRALYDEYFNNKAIDKGVISDEYTDETLESYFFRIINFTNPNTKLNKLKGLAKIYKQIDLAGIDRLRDTADSLRVAESVLRTILDNIEPSSQVKNSQSNPNGGSGNESDDADSDTNPNGGSGNDSGSNENQSDMNGDSDGSDSDSDADSSGNSNSTDGGKKSKSLTPSAKKQLETKFGKQRDFIRNSFKKNGLSKKEVQQLDSVEKSGTEMKNVGGQHIDGVGIVPPTKCVVSRKLTDELMMQSGFPFSRAFGTAWGRYDERVLKNGIALGTLLGKRLAIRNEERVTVNPRQNSGRIDKRLLSGLGYGYESVFSTKEVDKFKKVNLHISIDASGSMHGNRWDRAITTTIAICKAASMVTNLDVQVSIRGTWGGDPYICLAYDSRVDSFNKVKRYFPAFACNGTTPEGLCYEAIMNTLVECSNNSESYFLNLCDGEPNYSSKEVYYYGGVAVGHTKKMVEKMKERGIKVMAYYISESAYNRDTFKQMYGSGSRFIDVSQIVQIANTLNELFLQK